jgi:hypothetical protein
MTVLPRERLAHLARRTYLKGGRISSAVEAALERARIADILEIAERLGARLEKSGVEWVGPCPKCGGRDRFAINPKKQIFNCRGCATGGNVISLARLVHDPDFVKAVEFINGEQIKEAREAAPEAKPGSSDRSMATADALALWREGVDPRGTLAEKYLADRRLELGDDLAGEVLRWHPGVRAMLALFRNILTNEPQAISRTFLDCEGRKLKRMFLGPTGGAAAKLDADETVLEGLHAGEGVETCMAARQLLGLRPTWPLGSAGAIAAFPVLSGIEALTLLKERDEASARAVEECGGRWHAAGREVLINETDFGKDLNDELREGGAWPR